ncbi:MAG: ATP-dependent helicase HrpB [Rhizobiaceae bacterium]
MPQLPGLPVCDVLPELLESLQTGNRAVLAAPPGAGKTTIVPLSLLGEDWAQNGRLILVEPRRVATRAAARRMASLLDEPVGATVGYAMRMDNRSGPDTRVLAVTEGVFTRMALDDPELTGIAMVIFDEFHERSLDGDFGLALALDIAGALRPDLKIMVMSATLDTDAVSKLIDGPVFESAGRSFPVQIRYRPRKAERLLEEEMSKAIRAALAEEEGSCLAFLPGQSEIRRTKEQLEGALPASVDVIPLYGGLDGKTQDAAIRPAKAGRRKVVLATDIAESSITIDGVNIVIDSGLSRVPRYEPSTGLTRLETVRASRASVDQRAGRAGRTAPGVAIRLWHEAQTASLKAGSQPEIMEADLSGLLLDCASFGIADPQTLRLLDHPPAAAFQAARAQLRELAAIDQEGRLTATGRTMRKLPLPVRLAHMVVRAAERGEARKAAEIAVLLGERGLGGSSVDLDIRHDNLRRDKAKRAGQAKAMAQRLAANVSETGQENDAGAGRILLDACPDRVAKARGKRGHFVLANGRGAIIDEINPLAAEPFIVAADLQGKAQNARITAAAAISRDEIIALTGDRIEIRVQSGFDTASGSVRQREQLRLGAIKLRETALPPPSGDQANQAIMVAVRDHGLEILPWDRSATGLRQRLAWLHDRLGDPWPAMGDDDLISRLDDWLLPFLSGEPNLKSIGATAIEQGLKSLVPFEFSRRINEFAPEKWRAPTGNHLTVRYDSPEPVVAVRVQELYGADRHPAIAGGSVPLKLELLSPANRPIQTTLDLPGFWRGSWADVRKDMKSRYPKHVWPENPQHAEPTTRARPRGK